MTIILPRNDFLILYSISVQIHCHRNKENKFHQIFSHALASQPSALSLDISKLFECKFYVFHISDVGAFQTTQSRIYIIQNLGLVCCQHRTSDLMIQFVF